MNESKNKNKDIEEAVYCFDSALEQTFKDDELHYNLYIGRAKSNILIAQFGHTKDDCLKAKKFRETE
jgi:hypothetical protein